MGAPKLPPAPPPPPPAPSAVDSTVLEARRAERRRQMAAYGRRSTLLTSPGGDTSPKTLGYPSLLGSSTYRS